MPMLPRAGPKMLPWSNAHHIACPLRQSCPRQWSSFQRSPHPGSYFPGRRVAVTPYSLTKLGIPGFRKSAIVPPSPLYPAISPKKSIRSSPSGRCAPPIAAGRVGSSLCDSSTILVNSFFTPGNVPSAQKNGSLHMLQTTIEG